MVLLLTLAAGQGIPEASAQPKPTEYQVKAAYLYNFGKFVRWPSDLASQSTFGICILGQDPFGDSLDSLVRDEKINGHPIAVTRIASVQQSAGCRIIYISDSEARRLPSILAALAQAPVLTVGDSSDFVEKGGMIQFLRDGERIRFAVNLHSAAPVNLSFSSELLKVAASVLGSGQR